LERDLGVTGGHEEMTRRGQRRTGPTRRGRRQQKNPAA
jgi:hypothetical protein